MKNPILIGMLLFTLVACATTRSLISTPVKQTFDNALVNIELTPRKHDQGYYNGFQIVVTNKTDRPLEIDWQGTRYLLNDKTYDRLIFKGVTKDTINNLPPDVVPPGNTFSKVIYPLNLIAWKPYRSGDKTSASFSAGPLPEGSNGVALLIRQGSTAIRAKLVVSLRMQPR